MLYNFLSCKEKKNQLLKFCIEDDENIDLTSNGDKKISKREIPRLVIKTNLYNVGIKIKELSTVITPAAFQLLKDIIRTNKKNINYLCSLCDISLNVKPSVGCNQCLLKVVTLRVCRH